MSAAGVLAVRGGGGGESAVRPPATAPPTSGGGVGGGGSGKILQKRWVCDACRVRWFLDFAEACAHESTCDGRADSPPSRSSSGSSTPEISASGGAEGGAEAEASRISTDDGKPSSEEVAAVIARARKRVAAKAGSGREADSPDATAARRPGKGRAAAEVVVPSDVEENEAPGLHAAAVEGASVGASTEAGAETSTLSSSFSSSSSSPSSLKEAAAPLGAPSGRRQSKRLREAASKPPPLEDSAVQGNESNQAKGKKSKKNASDSDDLQKKKKRSKNGGDGKDKGKDVGKAKGKAKGKGQGKGGPLASIFLPRAAKDDSKAGKEKGKRAGDVRLPGGVSQQDYEEHVAAEEAAAVGRGKKRAAPAAAKAADHPRRVRRGQSEVPAEEDSDIEIVDGDSDESDPDSGAHSDSDSDSDSVVSVKVKGKGKGKRAVSQTLLAEHAAADFFAKRRQKVAEERERRRRREEERLVREATNGPSGSDNRRAAGVVSATLPDGVPRTQPADDGLLSAPRFPRPSHVLVDNDEDYDDVEAPSNALKSARETLRKTARHPHLAPDFSQGVSTSSSTDAGVKSLGFLQAAEQKAAGQDSGEVADLLSWVFGLREDVCRKMRDDLVDSDDDDDDGWDENNEEKSSGTGQLWADKHALRRIPEDILGADNQDAAGKLLSFVEEWKARRHKSVQIMGRAKKKKRRKRRSSSHGYDSDDSFLDGGENGGLESLFLITGPSGTGKTQLVHAAAEQMDCAVIEINSSEARGGAALKRAIQETTRSHSSLAVTRKKANGLFGKGSGADNEGEEDSEESDEDGDSCSESESDEESVKESHSLTIILIDEGKVSDSSPISYFFCLPCYLTTPIALAPIVDLLFDDDIAFWPALAQLSQGAKCPIVLTSTSIPNELGPGTGLKHRKVALLRPSPRECATRIAAVAAAEGLRFRRDVKASDEQLRRLSLIAEACQCDLRRILNEMHLFRSTLAPSADAERLAGTVVPQLEVGSHRLSVGPGTVWDLPQITGVEPLLVPKDAHTLITISGKNFLSQRGVNPLELFLGGVACRHFRVVDDCKIVAVCPPCVFPEGVSEEAIYEENKEIDCLTCKFLEVVARKRCANGLFLDSGADAEGSPHWNIEYDIPLRDTVMGKKRSRAELIQKLKAKRLAQEKKTDNDDGFMSSEEDGEDLETKEPDQISGCCGDVGEKHDDLEKAEVESKELEVKREDPGVKEVDPQTMLDEATAVIDQCGNASDPGTTLPLPENQYSFTLNTISDFADDLGCLSDVTLLEDSLVMLAVPSLSGPVEGFGAHAVDSSTATDPSINRLCNGKNKKPPSFEMLYSTGSNESGFFYGNIDSYVTRPSRRERELLSYSGVHSRGLGFLDVDICSPEEDSENSKGEEFGDEEDAEFTFLRQRMRVRSEDDFLLGPSTPPAFSLLPSLLEHGIGIARKHGFTKQQTPLVQSRKNQVATSALEFMHDVLANCDWWYCGLRHDGHESARKSDWLSDSVLDGPLSLDYLPFLRAIAHYEDQARRRLKGLANEEDNATEGRRRTRTRRQKSLGRRHYLEESVGAEGRAANIEVRSLELANRFMG
ncbi:hypothetical protein ACHAWF_015467 [Thalassiosira exigua]